MRGFFFFEGAFILVIFTVENNNQFLYIIPRGRVFRETVYGKCDDGLLFVFLIETFTTSFDIFSRAVYLWYFKATICVSIIWSDHFLFYSFITIYWISEPETCNSNKTHSIIK